MAAIPYMPLYIADYMADAGHLTTLEHGAYLLLIMNYWQTGKPLRALNGRLASVARMLNEDFEQIRPVLAEFFTESEGLWIHKRIEAELAKFRTKSSQARAAGLASAERRFNVRSTTVEIPFNHTDTDTDTDTDKKKSNTFVSPKAQPKNGSRLPFEECPTEWTIFGSEVMSWDGAHIAVTFSQFHDYWVAQPGVKGRKTDWLATWRNWCRNERKPNGTTGGSGKPKINWEEIERGL